jgi:hypothetical protein
MKEAYSTSNNASTSNDTDNNQDKGETMDTLSTEEKKRFVACESSIRNGLKSFYNVGRAVCEIREGRYYRETHATGDAYFSEKWDMTRQRVSQLVFAHHVYSLLKEFGFTTLPGTESQCRPLSRIPEGMTHDNDIIAVWSGVLETKNRITAKLVSDQVDAFMGKGDGKGAGDSKEPGAGAGTGDNAGDGQGAEGGAGAGADSQDTKGADKEAELLAALRDAQAKIAYLESALAAEKKAHQRTRTSAKHGMPTSKLAKDLFKAGFRAMAQKHHPDHGGDAATMKELNNLKAELGI